MLKKWSAREAVRVIQKKKNVVRKEVCFVCRRNCQKTADLEVSHELHEHTRPLNRNERTAFAKSSARVFFFKILRISKQKLAIDSFKEKLTTKVLIVILYS